jgi:hypothetical protein
VGLFLKPSHLLSSGILIECLKVVRCEVMKKAVISILLLSLAGIASASGGRGPRSQPPAAAPLKPCTRLVNAISAKSTDISLEDTRGFPPVGSFRIDSEIISYDFRPGAKGINRGAAGTSASKHYAGTIACLL